jgi:hypothetical protein
MQWTDERLLILAVTQTDDLGGYPELWDFWREEAGPVER